MAVVNNIGDNVGVLLGNGDGTFQPVRNFPVGRLPVALAVGDFNGDGRQDLAVSNSGDNTISVLLGNGDGSFQGALVTPLTVSPFAMTATDLNSDGKMDLVVCNLDAASVSVLLGNGDGTFTVSSLLVGGSPNGIAVGDFSGNGKLSLAVVVTSTPTGVVLVFPGNGDGTFGTPHEYRIGSPPVTLVTVDVNGDGIPDLAVLADTQVWTLLGAGHDDFRPGPVFEAGGSAPEALVTGDVNGDGKADLAVANYYSDAIWLLLNTTP